MGCRIKSQVKLDHIQDFEMMFERMKLHRPREAAVYYAILVIDSPKEFSEFLSIAEDLANLTRRPLIQKTVLEEKVTYQYIQTQYGNL